MTISSSNHAAGVDLTALFVKVVVSKTCVIRDHFLPALPYAT